MLRGARNPRLGDCARLQNDTTNNLCCAQSPNEATFARMLHSARNCLRNDDLIKQMNQLNVALDCAAPLSAQ